MDFLHNILLIQVQKNFLRVLIIKITMYINHSLLTTFIPSSATLFQDFSPIFPDLKKITLPIMMVLKRMRTIMI